MEKRENQTAKKSPFIVVGLGYPFQLKKTGKGA